MGEDPKKNEEGYSDTTPWRAEKRMERDRERAEFLEERDRMSKLMKAIFCMCEAAGFRVVGRVVVENVKSGRIWR